MVETVVINRSTQYIITYPYFIISCLASAAVANPTNAITVKDQRRLNMPAIKPIIGGPIKKPRKPIVETAARAMPGCRVVDLPASPYTMGTTEDTPNPTNKNQAVASTRLGKITAINRPVKMSSPLPFNRFFTPVLVTNQSAISRPAAMLPIKATYPIVV